MAGFCRGTDVGFVEVSLFVFVGEEAFYFFATELGWLGSRMTARLGENWWWEKQQSR